MVPNLLFMHLLPNWLLFPLSTFPPPSIESWMCLLCSVVWRGDLTMGRFKIFNSSSLSGRWPIDWEWGYRRNQEQASTLLSFKGEKAIWLDRERWFRKPPRKHLNIPQEIKFTLVLKKDYLTFKTLPEIVSILARLCGVSVFFKDR